MQRKDEGKEKEELVINIIMGVRSNLCLVQLQESVLRVHLKVVVLCVRVCVCVSVCVCGCVRVCV